jgi:NAD(P)-dependent dehydrogenase (short-subunit alcohol dehydrogenase family)
MSQLAGQVAIVTGAAGGLGRHYALALAGEACRLVICDIDPKIETFSAELRGRGVDAIGLLADVSSAQDVRRVVDAAQARFGAIHILINNAGIWRRTSAKDDLDASLSNYADLVGVNLKGEFMFGRAVIASMLRTGGGNIINIATDHVHTRPGRPTSGGPDMDLYDTSKWGVIGLTLSWAKALKEHGIRVNSFCMDATESEMLRSAYGREPTALEMAGWMRPEEVCGLAVELIEEGPSGRTGQNIGVWVGFRIALEPNPQPIPIAAR